MIDKDKIVKFFNSNNDTMVGIITELEPISVVDGFKISFRLYNATEQSGGYETSLWVKNAPIGLAKLFVAPKSEWKSMETLSGGKITSHKINNSVPVKYQYEKIVNQI